jgi:hypothetical protein
MSMKAAMVVAFALTTSLASPALAQTGSRFQAYDRHGAANVHHRTRAHSVHRGWNAYNIRGRYRGTDPDPFIRDQLRRCREC